MTMPRYCQPILDELVVAGLVNAATASLLIGQVLATHWALGVEPSQATVRRSFEALLTDRKDWLDDGEVLPTQPRG